MDKKTFFIFSDESGSWHDQSNVYIRSWIVIIKSEYEKLRLVIANINKLIGSRELKWSILANNSKYLDLFKDFDYRIFITISSPKDIEWTNYKIIRNYKTGIDMFDFGEIGKELKDTIEKKILDDIKYILFLNYYERFHIQNAKTIIEDIIKPSEYNLIFRIDPPQMLKKDWSKVLKSLTDKELEFPKSERDEGIQFADIVAGSMGTLIDMNVKYDEAKHFFHTIKNKFIPKNKKIPNPNLIFFPEINDGLKLRIKGIWEL